jgi:uncharacterized protein YndB with AHSA1/START domain
MTAVAVSQPRDSVRKVLSVQAPQEVAFRVFTAGFASWWPKESHKIGAAPAVDVVIEPRAGGRWYERGADGKDTPWGEVVAWEPPARLLLTWRIGADWAFHPEMRTEVEVRFVAEGKARTRVELEHRGLAAYGEKADEMRAAFDSPEGWGGMLAKYAAAAEAA